MKLEFLTLNAVIRGILPDATVTVVSVQWHGSDALTLVYRGPSGRVADEILYRHDEPPFSRCRRVMEPDGILVAIGGPPGRWLARAGRMLKAVMLRRSPGAGGSSRSSRKATRKDWRCWQGWSSAERSLRSSTGVSR